ncbi:hypothetical protein TPSD3_00010 [Thioflexithrix psekupsensis]|uniref:Uncharacterized protein n=2 Tax=Thioflexithrix psekupsensis TaxID=1570016 RepID=A0A251X5U9_9GAMM|nr:hypothetical protein TPSD3_16360 [Thioflexithrix psekupsensis]OUD12946.1 hypothetical protein TPSD3_12470 [Thioflexithrix psekupsensis]OUD16149.1 hypothetical protein TPSD3_00010 [Thioflexithrix psekupsensis]
MTFTPDEVAVIDEMVTIFGDSREDVVIKAVSLLYTVYKEDENAKNVFLQVGTKRVVIPLK